MDADSVDDLLEKYLALLDEYTNLQASLARLQSGMYQNIARANFSAERGIRYGPDFYDERMQALRLLRISHDPTGHVCYAIAKDSDTVPQTTVDEESPESGSVGEEEEGKEKGKTEKEEREERGDKPKVKDPLHWFGILTPMPLRQAQNSAVQAVEDTIPRLASVSAEMAQLEIEVRRTRKRRAKAVAAAGKMQAHGQPKPAEVAI